MKKSDYKPNGCGPWWLPDGVAGDYFHTQCSIHDEDYEKGLDRRKADKKFYHLMLARISEEKDWKIRLARRRQAWWFYYMVRVFGWASHKKSLESRKPKY